MYLVVESEDEKRARENRRNVKERHCRVALVKRKLVRTTFPANFPFPQQAVYDYPPGTFVNRSTFTNA